MSSSNGKVEYMCKMNETVSFISRDTSNVVESRHGPKQPKETVLKKEGNASKEIRKRF